MLNTNGFKQIMNIITKSCSHTPELIFARNGIVVM